MIFPSEVDFDSSAGSRKQVVTTNIDADTDHSDVANGDHEDSAAEVNNGIMSRRRNKKASRVTVKEEFLLLPPSEDQIGRGGLVGKLYQYVT